MYMYLKRLESVGFKSFAERIQVEFVPGVTAVVGPNGSGKSNITDAIRWVLGEQSVKSLRGSRMEDIIFQGSDTRKPLNVAEVTLILDNSDQSLPLDYDEVSVTRRVYRSGASEFYINKQACRLKDIIDLFMDSGLGREAFSIIGQGQVEEILSSKAEERRTIFEEAAGVLKYKQRKQKAEYKLAETDENLNRINDIIYEIEQQIEPLEEQATIAQTYLKRRELLKKQEISLLITEIERLHDRWQALLSQLEQEKLEDIAMKTAIQQKEAQLETERRHVHHLDETIEKLQAELLTSTQQLEQLDGKKRLFHERSKHFAENKQTLENQKVQAQTHIEHISALLADEKEILSELIEIQQKTKDKLSELNKQLTISEDDLAEKLEELKSEYIEHLNIQAAKRNEKQSVHDQKEQLDLRKNKQTEMSEQLVTKRHQLMDETKEIKEKQDAQLVLVTNKEQNLRQHKQKLVEKQSTYESEQRKLYEGYQTLAKVKSREEMLEEMKADYQGFFHGVKAVLKASEHMQLTKVIGAVLQLIDVPHSYVTAIETVLGGQAQHIVVEDEQAARQAINWLKQTNNGRATFLPKQSIRPRFVPDNILQTVQKHPGYINIASKLVMTDGDYEQVISHLMGNVIIAKSLKDANELARLAQYRFRIVTLDGDVVHPGGSMSGGARRQRNQSLFTRDKDLQETQEKVKEYQDRIAQFEEYLAKQQVEIEQLIKLIDEEETTLEIEEKKLQKMQSDYQQVVMELRTVNENLRIFDEDQHQFIEDSEQLYDREKQLITDLEQIKRQLQTIEKEIDELSEQEKLFKENQAHLQQKVHNYEISLAEQDERIKNQREKTERLNRQLSELKEQHQQYESELHELIHAQYTEQTEDELIEHIQIKQQTIDSITGDIQKKRADRVHRTQQIEDAERELREEHKKHEQFMKQIQQKEVQATRLDVDLENKLSHLQTEYTITYEKAVQTYEKAEDIDETKEVVQRLKQKIEQLGTVNIGAIDEFKRISERYTFLTEQKDDLVDAKQSLFSIIAEMDEEMKKRFSTTFNQIKEEFSVVFKELFGGGRAELQLTDPKNLLDTGIDIIAQPPGKKLQHLGLLSGGERALTAIALLFSILRVRPVPFCVLDEVEAALDEANVVRFAKYLKGHSEDTQFIVITHRKGTMEEADVLYGVTMQESGVSRLVSVLLEDTPELIKS